MKIICIGQNYEDHIKELNSNRPEEPLIFLKPDSSVLPKKNPFIIPPFTNDVHYEIEVLIKINKVGKFIGQKFAHKYYDDIGLGIDFTARDLQTKLKKAGHPWEKAKGFDGSAIISPFFSKKTFTDVNEINFSLAKNGKLVQVGSTKDMIFKIDELVAYVSQFFTLKKGDIIFTGTPAGVGSVDKNDVLTGFLEDKKVIDIKIK
ncbi:MAG: fumarylacetoacetate hydrolase family protein [Wenyingzhuangia sp.]|jgi:2-keto-4-pentenoate hydratase/2-oxohepta-3-ene-1,7-dioic acid hydratase in catechol pathway|uniref:fumarylacetoacetate hydrolase family protein n=1 Tax=Wenyingzhuangia sp. TaxID=1964193 RepID=UPI00321B445B